MIKTGSDVYLEWSGKTEEDEQKQITGYDITAGKKGYLRASIGMIEENKLLRLLFPDKYWENNSKDPFEFIGNTSMALMAVKAYLEGKPLDVQDRCDAQQKAGQIISLLLDNDYKWITPPGAMTKNERAVYAKSVLEFWKMGLKLQADGKKPYPEISW